VQEASASIAGFKGEFVEAHAFALTHLGRSSNPTCPLARSKRAAR